MKNTINASIGLTSRLRTIVVPSANDAKSNMRFDKDFEPGNLTVPEITLTGCISN